MKLIQTKRNILWVVIFFGVHAVFYAQVGNPFAPTSLIDAQSGGSVTGGLDSGRLIGNAQNAANTANNPFAAAAPGAAPAPAPAPGGYDDYSDYGYGDEYGGYGYGDYGGGGAQATPATPTPTPVPMTTVLSGERVHDAITRDLLDDFRFIKVPDNEIEGRFFDDGTHGDMVADDLLFTNTTEREGVIGAETNQVLNRLLIALRSSESLSPLEFYRMSILTTESISEISKWRQEESAKDKKLLEWVVKFVREYRQQPDDPTSLFWPVYVVQPPPAPMSDVAQPRDNDNFTWMPPTSPTLRAQQAEAAAPADADYGGYGDYGGGGGGYSDY